ncbi:tetratricopeptide repeat protein [Pendulispora brunnea]|uniref:Tetratricopeptide repeat protein n=1 Tax=Pendulispora brunnea TaxID=2905690 RepID=A0ABZ2KH48_9BACT
MGERATTKDETDAVQWSVLVVPLVACIASVVLTGVATSLLHAPDAPAPTPESVQVSTGDPEPATTSESDDADPSDTAAPLQTKDGPIERAPRPGFKSAPPTSESAALFADAGRARRVGAVPKAIALYELLQKRYPGTPESRSADMALALLFTRQGMHAAALEHFDRYLRHSPQGDLAAEAMWGKAQVLSILGRSTDAFRTLQRLQLLHPNSPYAIEARARLQPEASLTQ